MKKILLTLYIFILFISISFANVLNKNTDNSIGSILILVIFFIIFWILIIKPQQKKNKDIRKMLSMLNKGDEIITTGGIIGKIVKIDKVFIDLEISRNIIIKVQKNAVTNILPKGTITYI